MSTAIIANLEKLLNGPRDTAAWKLLGRALIESGDHIAALAAYEQGVVVAQNRGDIQAAREMSVFSRRIKNAMATAAVTPTARKEINCT